jgi:replicative DNA helicase
VSGAEDIKFDFGVDFVSSGDRVKDEAPERVELGKHELQYHHGFLDDCLRSILPHDFIILGAETGVGKTSIVTSIAKQNAKAGRRVYMIALEAEPKEIERRIKYEMIADIAYNDGIDPADLSYIDWYRGKLEHVLAKYNDVVDRRIALEYRTLHTYYRGSKFDHDDIRRLFLAIQDKADLIILDHLHYVDIEDENEARGFKRTVKMLRDVTLGIGKPVICVAHLRKKNMQERGQIVPDIERFHGASEVMKICTRAIMLAPCRTVEPSKWYESNTFIHVPKDRPSGATGHVALCRFDRRFKTYSSNYTLGRAIDGGTEWEPMPFQDVPKWARGHRNL